MAIYSYYSMPDQQTLDDIAKMGGSVQIVPKDTGGQQWAWDQTTGKAIPAPASNFATDPYIAGGGDTRYSNPSNIPPPPQPSMESVSGLNTAAAQDAIARNMARDQAYNDMAVLYQKALNGSTDPSAPTRYMAALQAYNADANKGTFNLQDWLSQNPVTVTKPSTPTPISTLTPTIGGQAQASAPAANTPTTTAPVTTSNRGGGAATIGGGGNTIARAAVNNVGSADQNSGISYDQYGNVIAPRSTIGSQIVGNSANRYGDNGTYVPPTTDTAGIYNRTATPATEGIGPSAGGVDRTGTVYTPPATAPPSPTGTTPVPKPSPTPNTIPGGTPGPTTTGGPPAPYTPPGSNGTNNVPSTTNGIGGNPAGSYVYPTGDRTVLGWGQPATTDAPAAAYNQGDPGYMSSDDRNRAIAYGQDFQNEFGSLYNQDLTNQNYYNDQANLAFQNLNALPGYSDAESNAILDSANMYGSMTTGDEFAGNYLTPDEQAAIYGDPTARAGGWDSGAGLDARYNAGATATRDTFNKYAGNVNDTLATARTNTASDLANYGTNLRGAVSDLSSAIKSNYDTTSAGYDKYLDPNLLTYGDDYVNELKDQAGRTVGATYGAQEDDLVRRAAAAGNVNPLALASARSSIGRQSGISRADAVTDADIAARAAQLTSRQQFAQMGIGANTSLGNLGEQGAEYVGSQATGAEKAIADAQLQNEQYLTGAGVSANENLASTGTGMEANLLNAGQQEGQFTANTNIGVARDISDAQNARATALATNRQQIAQANETAKYNQGTTTSNAISGRYKSLADARIAGQDKVRNYLTGQQSFYGGQLGTAATNQLTGAQASMSGAGDSTKNAISTEIGRRANPSFTTQIIGSFLSP